MNSLEISILEKGKILRKSLGECLGFDFKKERYTPYSIFKARFLITQEIDEIVDVQVKISGVLVHKGLIDKMSITQKSDGKILSISSRSYTSALGINVLAQGVKYGVSLSHLVNECYEMPFIQTQEGYDKICNYIYVKEHTSLWDVVVNMCMKLEGDYPYIRYANVVSFSKHNPMTVEFSHKNIVEHSDNVDNSKMISHIHMDDIDGNSNVYNLSNSYAIERNIVRHRQSPFDRQWLNMSDIGLSHKINYTMRGVASEEILYKGFRGEDINDKFSYEKSEGKFISCVRIFGDENGIFTKLLAYKDAYCN